MWQLEPVISVSHGIHDTDPTKQGKGLGDLNMAEPSPRRRVCFHGEVSDRWWRSGSMYIMGILCVSERLMVFMSLWLITGPFHHKLMLLLIILLRVYWKYWLRHIINDQLLSKFQWKFIIWRGRFCSYTGSTDNEHVFPHFSYHEPKRKEHCYLDVTMS